MGYDMHITRAPETWIDNDGHWITRNEWLALVASDPELRLAEDWIEHGQDTTFAIWSGPSEYEEPWFAWDDGNIQTKNPDKPMVDKMVAIAKRLNAIVQGDDGEIYDQHWREGTYYHGEERKLPAEHRMPPPPPKPSSTAHSKPTKATLPPPAPRPWWKRLFGR